MIYSSHEYDCYYWVLEPHKEEATATAEENEEETEYKSNSYVDAACVCRVCALAVHVWTRTWNTLI